MENGGRKVRRSARRPSVVAYLLTAFTVSLVTLLVVTAMSTATSFDRERERAESDLRTIAERTAGWSDLTGDLDGFLGPMAKQPAMTALDATGCQLALDGLEGLLHGYVHVVRADGSELCGIGDKRVPNAHAVVGPWLAKTLSTEGVFIDEPGIDRQARVPSVLAAERVIGANGTPVGAVVAVLYTGEPFLDEGERFPADTRVFLLDASRSLVLGTTSNAKAYLGAPLEGGRPHLSGDHIWTEVAVANMGWHVVAAVPASAALAPARAELRRTALVGSVSLLVVLLLGVLLHRRLARPVRRLGRALQASLDGDEAARAPVEGPAEVARAAEVFNDLIAERQSRERDLAWQASHDGLTGLPNRAALTARLHEALTTGVDVAALFLDLDRFKLINDSHGHAVGDRVLVALGHRLAESIAGAGVLGRFGGDEFVAVCPGIGGEAGASTMAAQLAETLRAPLRFEAQEIWRGGSIGIALATPSDSAEDVLRNADTAMYRAKENGRGGYAVFDQQMRDWAVLRLDIERDLHRAVERDELVLHYQPKVSLDEGAPVGAEALVRWQHPERGMVPPGDFIPVAEETGLIVPLGRWVLEQAAMQASTWRRSNGGVAVPVAVNLSTHQLADPALPSQVAASLGAAGALPTDIIIEITESAVLQDVEGATERLAALRDMGVRVSIDDFGTGYSSLSYLQRLPIDELKIDRSFVQRLGHGPTGAIVGSIVDLAHAIGLSVVAEGIETEDQLALLRDLECDLGQGFLLARPQPSLDVGHLLRRRSLAPATPG
jgi:diguanylate cyclase (GGDEF)-like protein